MAGETYSVTALVLRRTKLGETDVICSFLCEDGSPLRAVAKGARKPNSVFSSRLELFSVCRLLIARGRNLDIVKEAKLVCAHQTLRTDISYLEAASPMVELLDRSVQDGVAVPRLFAMTQAAFDCLEQVPAEQRPFVCIAHLLKALAFLGFRPVFNECVSCGEVIDLSGTLNRCFSYFEGGTLCPRCAMSAETVMLKSETLAWAQFAMYSSFEEITQNPCPDRTIRELLHLVNQWISVHLGFKMKSMQFLLVDHSMNFL